MRYYVSILSSIQVLLQVDGAHSACLQPASSVSADGMDILQQLL